MRNQPDYLSRKPRHINTVFRKNNVDLFGTLKAFLLHNGNVREASNALFIHRSTLEYRIDRIAELLNVDLNDADVRFELLMAYKLYNLFDFTSSELM